MGKCADNTFILQETGWRLASLHKYVIYVIDVELIGGTKFI